MGMQFVLRLALLPGLMAVVAAAPATPPPPAELTKADATGVLSRMVLDEQGREIGRVVDVVVDPTGQPRAVVVDVGGFMGVGSRRVAVAWSAVHVPAPGASDPRVTIDMSDDQIRAAPGYNDRSKPATIVGPATTATSGIEPDTDNQPPFASTPPAPTPPTPTPPAPTSGDPEAKPPATPGGAQSPTP